MTDTETVCTAVPGCRRRPLPDPVPVMCPHEHRITGPCCGRHRGELDAGRFHCLAYEQGERPHLCPVRRVPR